MKQEEFILTTDNRDIKISVIRKNVRRITLRVYIDGTVRITAPGIVSFDTVKRFAEDKKDWIKSKTEIYKDNKVYAEDTVIKDNGTVRLLGCDVKISVIKSDENKAVFETGKIKIYTETPDNTLICSELYHKWYNSECLKVMKQLTDRYYPLIAQFDIAYPNIVIKPLKSMWGNCNIKQHRITYNSSLLKTRPEFTEYVVLHELSHFIYPNHSRDFYNFIGNYMPDWKERKKLLDT